MEIHPFIGARVAFDRMELAGQRQIEDLLLQVQ